MAGIDARWLGEALSAGGIAKVGLAGGHSGTTTRERITIEGVDGAAPPGLPDRFFVKLTPVSAATQLFGALFGLGRTEVRFYDEIAADVPIPLPRHFVARAAERGGRFVLLLEDLEARGCRFPAGQLDLADARAIVQALGRLHAAFWESPRFHGDLSWVRRFENRDNIAIENWMSARANLPSIERFTAEVSADVRTRSHEIHLHRERLEAYWSEGPRTLLHGDAHMGNLFFDGERAGYFDWQVVQCGQGIRDVCYWMTNSLETGLRRAHEEELVALYLETLRRGGVCGPGVDPDWVWERYRAHTLYVWIASSVTAATPGLQPEEVARAAMQRTSAAIDDHGAFELLDEIVSR